MSAIVVYYWEICSQYFFLLLSCYFATLSMVEVHKSIRTLHALHDTLCQFEFMFLFCDFEHYTLNFLPELVGAVVHWTVV